MNGVKHSNGIDKINRRAHTGNTIQKRHI